MGGKGSGRPGGWGRDTVEDYRSLDANRLHADGCLAPGWSGSLRWTRDDEEAAASIALRAETDRIVLSYRHCFAGGEWQDVEEPVRIARVPCRFGGERPYLLCPGIVDGIACGRRAAKLYGADRYFLCRHCYSLTYTSKRLEPLDRAWQTAHDRASRIRRRLGGTGRGSPHEGIPARPKGMWKKTYRRLRREAMQAEGRAEAASWRVMMAIVERADRAGCRGE